MLTSNVKTRDLVLLGKSEAELLGVVVDFLDLVKLQANEALVTTLEGLWSRAGWYGSADLVLDLLDSGVSLGGTAVEDEVAACSGSSGDTTV